MILCRTPFPDTKKQDINLIYYADVTSDFENAIRTTVNSSNEMLSEDLKKHIKVGSIPRTAHDHVFLLCNVTSNFCREFTSNWKKHYCHIFFTILIWILVK